MGEEAAPVEPQGDPPNDPAKPAPEVKTFTADQVSAIVQTRLAEDRARRAKAETPAGKPPSKASVIVDEYEARIAQLELRNSFDKRAAKFDLTDEASDDLFTLYAAKRPEDPSVWFGDVAQRFNLKPLGATTTQQPANPQLPPQQPNNAHPVTDRGAPPAPKVPLEEQDFGRMSSTDLESLRLAKGDKWFNEQLSRQMKGRRFVLPKR